MVKIYPNQILVLAFFAIVFLQLFAEYSVFNCMVFCASLLGPIVLLVLYRFSSTRQNPLVYGIFGLLVLMNFFLGYSNSPYFMLSDILSILQQLLMLVVVFESAPKRYASWLYGAVPLMGVFYYLNSILGGFAFIEFNTLFFQSILVSLLGGISLAAYLQNDNRQNSWLLISILLFIGLQFVVFIERQFAAIIPVRIFALIGIVLNSFGFFTFYKFVSASERNDKNYV